MKIYGFDSEQGEPLPADAPPIFIAATQGDTAVPAEQSVIIFTEWTKAKVPSELHLYNIFRDLRPLIA